MSRRRAARELPPLLDHELIVDNFAGGGGASTGLEIAFGRSPDVAINHDPEAIAMHAMNHPTTVHYCQSIFQVDPDDVVRRFGNRPIGVAWFSPDCTHHSKARGGKPRKKHIRDLAWVCVLWAQRVKPRVICIENVEEFRDWGPLLENGQPCPVSKGQEFRKWCAAFKRAGYRIEHWELRACDYGAPTSRKRLFIVARRDKAPIVKPEPLYGKAEGLLPYRTAAECIDWSDLGTSIFERDRPLAENTLRRIAHGTMRYVVNSPKPFIVNLTHGGREEPIDEPMRTVTGANRGEKALATPIIARIGQTGTKGGKAYPVEDPLTTVTSKAEHLLVVPTLIQTGYGERPGQAPRVPGLEKPLGTIMATGEKHALVAAFLAQHNTGRVGSPADAPLTTLTERCTQQQLVTAFIAQHNSERKGVNPGRSAEEPLSTVTQKGCQQSVVAVHVQRDFGNSVGQSAEAPLGTTTAGGGGKSSIVASHLVKLRGTCRDGQPMDEPAPTISAQGTHLAQVNAFLLKYYGTDQNPRLEDPLHAVTSKDRFGLVTVLIDGEPYVISDIRMRMLSPRELFKAQGFPDDYEIEVGKVIDQEGNIVGEKRLTKTSQVAKCGNSVCPPIAAAVAGAQFGIDLRKKLAA